MVLLKNPVPFSLLRPLLLQMVEPDDIELLREFAGNASEAAFATLVRRQVNLVYSVALRRTRSPHAAEEITQASSLSWPARRTGCSATRPSADGSTKPHGEPPGIISGPNAAAPAANRRRRPL